VKQDRRQQNVPGPALAKRKFPSGKASAVVAVSLALGPLSCGGHDPNAATSRVPPNMQQADGSIVIPADSPKLKEIRVAIVRSAEVPTDEVVSPGQIEVNPNRVSRVLLPVTGKIATVLVKIGDRVHKDEPLLTLESPEAEAAQSAYLQALAGLNQSKAVLVKAQADYDRSTDLFEHNALAKKEVLSAESALVQAKSAVEQSEASRQQTIRRLELLGLKPGAFGEKVVVSSPMSGKVLEMSVAPGEYRNDTNAAVMTIADLSTVWVASDVPESYIRFIQPGERIDVTLTAYPGEVFRGRVTRIADTVDPQTRTIKVRAEMNNSAEKFRPEMFGTIRHTESMHVVPVIPPGSVIEEEGRNSVFVESSPGHFHPINIQVGKRYGDMLPVISGLKPGDRIVVDGAMLLKGQ
jgi:cobalt-zinc-cadmium efflux system membrane fusion protein